MGSVVRAVVVSNGSTPNDRIAADLQDEVRRRIGRHASVRIVDFVASLPRTETGKLRRNALRDAPPAVPAPDRTGTTPADRT